MKSQLKSPEEVTVSVGNTQVPIITESKINVRKMLQRRQRTPAMSLDRSDEAGSVQSY